MSPLLQKVGALPGSWRAKHDRIPPELTDMLYQKARELSVSDLSPASVARRLSTAYSLNLDPGTIRHWMVGDRNPTVRNRSVLRQEPSPELSYIIGANIGDGCTLAKENIVKLAVTDRDFAEAFNRSMASLFSRRVPNRIMIERFNVKRLPIFSVRYFSKQLVRLLRLPLTRLLEIASAYPREFLRGLFDAEGYVSVGVGREFHLTVGAENSDKLLLVGAKKFLLSLGIESTLHQKRKAGSRKTIRGQSFLMKRTSYGLVISRIGGIRSFANEVGFSIKRKTSKLLDAINLIDTVAAPDRPRVWRQLYSKIGGEWLRR